METNGLRGQLSQRSLVQRRELIMLMEQALANLGFHGVGQQLEIESGIAYETVGVSRFRRAVLRGQFGEAVELLSKLGIGDTGATRRASFLIHEQQFLELLAAGDVSAGVSVLQRDLASLGVCKSRLHKLAGCVLCTSEESLRNQVEWRGAGDIRDRERLLRSIQEVVPPDVMVPEARLEQLLEQALVHQLAQLDVRVPMQQPISLMTDFSLSHGHIPTRTTQVLMDHFEEVWHLEFSHDGQLLASASKDATAIVWDVLRTRQLRKRHTLRGHTDALTFCAWSPDDRLLATCSMDHDIRLWDAHLGTCRQTITRHDGPTMTAAWLPDGQGILTTGEDKCIHLSYVEGDSSASWQSDGVNELIMLPDGRLLVTPYGENKVEVWSTPRDGQRHVWDPLILEEGCIVSCTASRDGRRLALNMASRAVHLWRIPGPRGGGAAVQLQRLRAGKEQRQSRFVVRSSFGGYNDCYVASGSEECKVYVWHSTSGKLLASLEGHSGTVNAVSWNPNDHLMFASASDDKSIHVWGLDPEAGGKAAGQGAAPGGTQVAQP